MAEIERALALDPSAAERADLGFALARLLDLRGDYARAFAACEAANRASRASFGPTFRGYDRGEQEALVNRLMAAFPAPAGGDGPEQPPIFILGMFRSGSTLVEQIVSGHSAVVSGGELDLVPSLAARIRGYPEAAGSAGEADLEAWRRFYREGVERVRSGPAIVTDKRPDNFLHIGLVKALFPKAKIVHTRRNRLDNLVSVHFAHLAPTMAYALDLADSAHWHAQYERLMAHWKSLYPDDIFDVDYDELVRDPEPLLKRLVAFLGLEWEEGLLDFHARKGPVKTASVWQVREPLHARSSGRWRNYEKQLKTVLGEI